MDEVEAAPHQYAAPRIGRRATPKQPSSCAQSQDPREPMTLPQGWIPRLRAE